MRLRGTDIQILELDKKLIVDKRNLFRKTVPANEWHRMHHGIDQLLAQTKPPDMKDSKNIWYLAARWISLMINGTGKFALEHANIEHMPMENQDIRKMVAEKLHILRKCLQREIPYEERARIYRQIHLFIDGIKNFDSYFPETEKAPFSMFLSAMESRTNGACNDFAFFAASAKDHEGQERVISSLSASWLAEAGGFLGYLYVQDNYRRLGIGRMLINKAIESFQKKNNGKEPTVIGEIEHSGSEEANHEKEARGRFFSSLGFMKVTGINYLQPYQNGFLPMVLIIRPEKGKISYPAEEIIEQIRIIYRDVPTYRMIKNEIKQECLEKLKESCKQTDLKLVPI